MDKLNRSIINGVKTLLETPKNNVALGSTLGQFLADYQDLGSVDAQHRYIRFTPAQKRDLQQELIRDFGNAFWQADLSQKDRLETAGFVANEKLAGIAPDERFVLIKSFDGHLGQFLRSDIQTQLPLGQSMRCHLEQLQLDQIKYLVVIENLAVFDAIHTANLPEELKAGLFVYRGHNGLAKGTKRLLEISKDVADCKRIAWCDYDPAGLEILLTLPNIEQMLYPQMVDAQLDSVYRINSQSDFLKQHKQLRFVERAIKVFSPELQRHFQQIRQHKLSIKQEHMLAQQFPLLLAQL